MRLSLQIFLSILFIPLFLIFLILTSLKFQILNYEYLTSTFEKNNIYKNVDVLKQSVLLEMEKKGDLEGELDINITPEMGKEFLEKNLKSILGFINGKASEVIIFIPGQASIELTKLAPNFPKNQLESGKNIGKYAFMGWVISLILVLGIIFSRFLSPKFLIFIGVIFIILGIIVRFFLIQMGRDLVQPGNSEPSQVLIGMMANSILPEVVNLWIILSGCLIIVGVGLLIYRKIKKT